MCGSEVFNENFTVTHNCSDFQVCTGATNATYAFNDARKYELCINGKCARVQITMLLITMPFLIYKSVIYKCHNTR